MRRLRDEMPLALSSTAPVLLTGESGTGKTVLARAMAEASGRRPVVRAMLGASDDLNTITSELFGHERGAFSGAQTHRTGLVEHANGGTLILDEVLNLPMHAQQLLLDFTQFGTYRPLGHARAQDKRSDVWLFAVTNGDLAKAVAEGRFREDLYYRLAGVELRLPTLREARADIPELAVSLLSGMGPCARRWSVSSAARRMLLCPRRAWQGNVRELQTLLRRAHARALLEDAGASCLRADHLDPSIRGASVEPVVLAAPADEAASWQVRWSGLQDVRDRIEQNERDLIHAALRAHDGVIARAARELGIPRTTLASRLKKLGVDACV